MSCFADGSEAVDVACVDAVVSAEVDEELPHPESKLPTSPTTKTKATNVLDFLISLPPKKLILFGFVYKMYNIKCK
jgi:hypothetical protein